MTKKEIVSRIAQLTGLHQAQVRAVMDEFARLVAETMRQGEKITLRNFGSFFSQECASRRIRHPATGVLQVVPDRRRAAFRASDKLHYWVNLEPEQIPTAEDSEPPDPDQLGLFGE
ncbi:MAG: HU family DNA-binding protein [Candidatus Glassbacteria bacterium]|nr:HU family DNA-binding protein [Candidatus Glassbacteria bacterium]